MSLAVLGSVGTSALAQKASGQASAKKHPQGVRGMFDAAMELYDAGKYPQALSAFAALLRKYPGHEPAAIQYAKTLYRMDRIKEAYGSFARLNPQHLDAETSYEYGWSFYTNKQWQGALYAFQRVPKGHALYDLANYYGALCAIKLKKYDDAEDMLDKAVVLPDKLAKSRSLYVKHVQALRLMQQKSQLAKDREKEKEALDAQNKKKTKKDDAGAKPAAADQGYQHQGFKQIDKSATVKYTDEQVHYNYAGYKDQYFDERLADFNLNSGVVLPLPLKSGKVDGKDRQAAFGLQLGLGAEDEVVHGAQAELLQDDNDADLTRDLNSQLATDDIKVGTASAEAWLEVPFPEGVWGAIGALIDFYYYNFDRGSRIGDRKAYIDLNGKAGNLTYGGEVSYTEILDIQTQPIMSVTDAQVTFSGDIIPKLNLALKGYYDIYDYLADVTTIPAAGLPGPAGEALAAGPNVPIDGPDSVLGGQLKATEELPLGFKVSVAAYSKYFTNYIVHGLPTYGEVSADGQVLGGKAALTATPTALPFISGAISQSIEKTTWKLDNEGARDTWDINVPDYVDKFVVYVSLNLAF